MNERTIHLPEQNIDVTLRVDYLDTVAVESAGLEKLDAIGYQFDPTQKDDASVRVPFAYTIARQAAILARIPKRWTWTTEEGTGIALAAESINRLPITDAKLLATAARELYDEVEKGLRDPSDPKDSASRKR